MEIISSSNSIFGIALLTPSICFSPNTFYDRWITEWYSDDKIIESYIAQSELKSVNPIDVFSISFSLDNINMILYFYDLLLCHLDMS